MTEECRRCHKQFGETYRIFTSLYCRYCFTVLMQKIDAIIKEETTQ